MEERAFRVVLVPLPGGLPGLVRLRQALKSLPRTHRLRCRSIEEIELCAPSSKPGGVA